MLYRFLAIVQVLARTAEAADHYADIRHQLVMTGQLIGDMEMMIAAHAFAIGAALATNNICHYDGSNCH